MAHIRLLWNNRYTDPLTDLVASSAVSALPVGFTQNPDRNKVWRSSTGTGTQTIDIDLGSVLAVTAVALANVTVLGAGAVELYQRGDGASPGAATLVVTLAAQDSDRLAGVAYFASQSHRHWQLKWTNPGSVNAYAECGFVGLGTYDEPTVNVRVPIPLSHVDPTQVSQSSDGQESFAVRTKYTQGAWVFDAVLEAQLTQLRTMFAAIGVATPLFVTLDGALSWTTWFVRLTGGLQVEIEPDLAIGRYRVTVPFREVR